MKSRTQYSILNSGVSTTIYLIRMLIGFILRFYFIKYLGVEYLGLNGLFTNILSFLSLTELGVGTTIVYELYKPLASNDKQQVVNLMELYKKVYHIIGIVVAVVGLLVIPLIPFMIKGQSQMTGITFYYILFLSNSVISYFFTYKRSLINADQKNYVTVINDFAFYLGMAILQILVLVVWKNFYAFLIIQVLSTLLSNISISRIVDRQYPYLKTKSHEKISSEVVSRLKRNVIGNISSQIGAILVLGSDNIIISGFVGLSVVGIYSNYTIITNALRSLAGQVTNSVVSSVGNLVASGNEERSFEIFNLHLFITKSIAFFAGLGIYIFINPFITIWIGKKYLLPSTSVFLIAIYSTIFIYQGTSRTFINSYGLYWQQRWKSIFESIVNISVSIVLIKIFGMGLNGVLLGTLLSSVTVIMWFEPFVVFKYGFHKSVKGYMLEMVLFYLLLVLLMFGLEKLSNFFIVSSIGSFFLWLVVGFILILLFYLIIFGCNKEFKLLIDKFTAIVKHG